MEALLGEQGKGNHPQAYQSHWNKFCDTETIETTTFWDGIKYKINIWCHLFHQFPCFSNKMPLFISSCDKNSAILHFSLKNLGSRYPSGNCCLAIDKRSLFACIKPKEKEIQLEQQSQVCKFPHCFNIHFVLTTLNFEA